MKPIRLFLLALAGTFALLAQGAPRATADIPFAFELVNQKFAAGGYELVDLGHTDGIQLRDSGTKALVYVLARRDSVGTKDAATARLVFNKYGDRHFLAEVWYPNFTRTLMKSRSERALVTSKLVASGPERVIVLARVF
jgi:hypothetical protein